MIIFPILFVFIYIWNKSFSLDTNADNPETACHFLKDKVQIPFYQSLFKNKLFTFWPLFSSPIHLSVSSPSQSEFQDWQAFCSYFCVGGKQTCAVQHKTTAYWLFNTLVHLLNGLSTMNAILELCWDYFFLIYLYF